MKNIYKFLSKRLDQKESLVLSTIIETKGSSPQVPGASAVFSSKGLITGTLGGGWMEADAQKKALEALNTNAPLMKKFRLYADINAGEGAICGGEITILFDTRPDKHRDTFDEIIRSLDQRKAGVLVTLISGTSGEEVNLYRYWIAEGDRYEIDTGEHRLPLRKEIEKTITRNEPCLSKIESEISLSGTEESLLFLEPVFPLPRLVIVGAGHIGRALSHIGSLLNFEVVVFENRPEFATKENLPDADQIIVEPVGEVLKNYTAAPDTYFVIVTPSHQQDAEALRQVITSEATYIGMIGSKRKIALIKKKFLEEKWATEDQFNRVHAPIGIDINSKTVEEIAISIAAQLVFVRNADKNKIKDSK